MGAIDLKGITLFATNEVYKSLKMQVGATFTPSGLRSEHYDYCGHVRHTAARACSPGASPQYSAAARMTLRLTWTRAANRSVERIDIRGNTKT